MTTFGPGDYGGYNDWAFSGTGGGTFPINWNTSTFATGVLGRITAIAARWDYYTGLCASCNGQNAIWDTSNNLVRLGTAFASSGSGAGTNQTMNNIGCGDVWQNNASYYIGFVRDGAQCSIHSWKDNAQGGYAGKSGSASTNTGGTVNWGGTTNGGLPVYGTVTDTNIYVRRSGAWSKTFVYVRRSGAWTGPVYVYVRRSGAWTLLNKLKEHEIPKKGEEALVDIGDGLERGLIVEEGETSWFGNVDPAVGRWTGRYHSHEGEEVAEERLKSYFLWDQAMRWENYDEAKVLLRKHQPPGFELPIVAPKTEEDLDPILVGCGCG